MLKEARNYRLFSRTIIPLLAVYTASVMIGRGLYLGLGRFGLFRGPFGDLRRAFIDTAPHRPIPSGDLMDWFSVALFAWVLLAELGRRQSRRAVAGERLLLAGYSLGVLCAFVVALMPKVPEVLYAPATVLAAGLLASACWKKWPYSVRIAATGVAVVGAGIAIWALRMRDLARLGHLG